MIKVQVHVWFLCWEHTSKPRKKKNDLPSIPQQMHSPLHRCIVMPPIGMNVKMLGHITRMQKKQPPAPVSWASLSLSSPPPPSSQLMIGGNKKKRHTVLLQKSGHSGKRRFVLLNKRMPRNNEKGPRGAVTDVQLTGLVPASSMHLPALGFNLFLSGGLQVMPVPASPYISSRSDSQWNP